MKLQRNEPPTALALLNRMALVVEDGFEQPYCPPPNCSASIGKTAEAADFIRRRIKAVPWDSEARLQLARNRSRGVARANATCSPPSSPIPRPPTTCAPTPPVWRRRRRWQQSPGYRTRALVLVTASLPTPRRSRIRWRRASMPRARSPIPQVELRSVAGGAGHRAGRPARSPRRASRRDRRAPRQPRAGARTDRGAAPDGIRPGVPSYKRRARYISTAVLAPPPSARGATHRCGTRVHRRSRSPQPRNASTTWPPRRAHLRSAIDLRPLAERER